MVASSSLVLTQTRVLLPQNSACFPTHIWNLHDSLLQPRLTQSFIISYTMPSQFCQTLILCVIHQAEATMHQAT